MDIDSAAGGYDPPSCECVYVAATDTMDSEDCALHGGSVIPVQPLLGNSLSPTQVRALLDCSARWWFKYGVHLPEPKTANLALGIAVHQALEANFREKLDSKEDLPLQGVTALFRQAWALLCQETEFRDDENPREIGELGEKLVGKYMEEAAPAIEPAAVELEVEGKIGGAQVVGKIDLIDTAGCVVDVKTSARKHTGIAPDHAFQLATYRQLAPGANGEARINTLVKTKTVQLIQQCYRAERSRPEIDSGALPVGAGGDPQRAVLSQSPVDALQPAQLRLLAAVRARIRRHSQGVLSGAGEVASRSAAR